MAEQLLEKLPPFSRSGHVKHSLRCLSGIPAGQVEADPSRTAIGFYALGSLDILGLLETKTKPEDRENWKQWLWAQQSKGLFGTGFKGSTYMTPDLQNAESEHEQYSEYDTPSLIMTYTAILSLAILRDDFSRLDREGLIQFLKACQCEDGSFAPLPNGGEADLRSVYCAFVISSMLDDWSGIDLPRSIAFIQRCASYEGGFAQTPFAEAIGGTTYCALAALSLVPRAEGRPWTDSVRREKTIRWLIQNQTVEGGFCGRTNKLADACYCFWCTGALQLLGADHLVNIADLAQFLARCQSKFGGVSKGPEGRPDPYHTYMTIAALATCPIPVEDESWHMPRLHVAWNVTEETADWIKLHVSRRPVTQ